MTEFLKILFEILLTWEEGCFVQIIWFVRLDQLGDFILSGIRCFTYMLTVKNDNFFSKLFIFCQLSIFWKISIVRLKIRIFRKKRSFDRHWAIYKGWKAEVFLVLGKIVSSFFSKSIFYVYVPFTKPDFGKNYFLIVLNKTRYDWLK